MHDPTSYGSEGMRREELSLPLLDIAKLPVKSVLILEELGTHVSPRSQDSRMNVVAMFPDSGDVASK
jgi:hypothetical protein